MTISRSTSSFIKTKLRHCTSSLLTVRNSTVSSPYKTNTLFELDLQNERESLAKRFSLACNSHVADKVKASKFFVFLTLLYRTTIDQLRDKEFKAKCIQHLITALIIGAIFIRIPWNQHDNPYLKKVRRRFKYSVTINSGCLQHQRRDFDTDCFLFLRLCVPGDL